MDYIGYVLIGIVIAAMSMKFMPIKGVRQISVADLKNELKDKNKQFIDVRTSGEYRGFNLREFKNIPLHQLKQKAEKELVKEKEVVVICQSGMRSQNASKVLKKLGFEKVTNVRGGMSAWK
ncbi:rhodanese-like domain-containing protein [Mangrovibacillus cuniculi]|uniref:Rhodanese-like domain-containing protein n=1 Tax=Mangrovibacillus cuniculi TaxID=2593652 RepID=A0A7S8CEG3_9BACI|nr:rhodanese-like domain-containing protein [Mangrovibacillus cuniculi]QPC48328.1 rhodanese-like domain-containing protein [Mangrovibacillus cuniculi]